jgi:hypothetical protein
VTKNLKGLLNALQQSINEAVLESHDVAAAVAALKRTGKCPVFTIDISMQDPHQREDELEDEPANQPSALPLAPPVVSSSTEELVLSDADVKFLGALGISDPSWCHGTSQSSTA